jgi:hypothetical protein
LVAGFGCTYGAGSYSRDLSVGHKPLGRIVHANDATVRTVDDDSVGDRGDCCVEFRDAAERFCVSLRMLQTERRKAGKL